MEIEVYKGELLEFQGSYMSGLGQLLIMDEEEGMRVIFCENAITVSALENAFGNVIGEAHNVKRNAGFVGKKVFYSVDGFNILTGFTPVKEASKELKKLYRKQKKERSAL